MMVLEFQFSAHSDWTPQGIQFPVRITDPQECEMFDQIYGIGIIEGTLVIGGLMKIGSLD